MRPLDWAAAWAVVLLWAFNFIVAKVAVGQVPPLFFLVLRFALVAVLLIPFLRPLGRRWPAMIALSVVLGSGHFGLLFVGLSGVDAGVAAIATQLGVPFSALLARIVFKDRLGAWQIAGMAVAFAGIWLLAGTPDQPPDPVCFTFVVAAAFAWAAANILIKRLGAISPFVLNAWFAVFAVPQLLLASLLTEEGQLAAVAAADWRGFGAVVYTAVGASIAAYGLWYFLIGRHEMSRIVPMMLLAPVIAVGLAVLLLDEPLDVPTVAGGLIVLGGVAMIQFLRPDRRGAGVVAEVPPDRPRDVK